MVEAILSLAQEPWRTFFILLALTAMRAGEALGLQWGDIDFDHRCIHIRRSAWYGKIQSTKSRSSAAPVTMPEKLASVLSEYQKQWKSNAQGFLFTTRNDRPPSSNKVVAYQLWPILDALGIPIADSTHSVTQSRLSSWTRATRQKSHKNSSDMPTPARHRFTFICAGESLNRQWRTSQIL